jgi:predicted DNA-binding protein
MKTAKGKILGGARPGSGRKPRTEDKKTVSAYLKPELHRRLRDAAKAEGKSSSALITEAIEKYLNYKIMGEISYAGYQVLVREDKENWYVDFQTGLGEGIYPKDSFSLKQALKDQMNIYKR